MNAQSWKHAESENFIYHFTDEKEAETVLFHAETYFAWIKQMFGVQEVPTGRKSHVFIFNDDQLWDEFRHRGTMEHIGGAEAFTDGNELYIHRIQFWLETPRVLAHELTHVVLFRFLDERVPLYLNEGYAEYIGNKAIAMKFSGNEYAVRTSEKVPEKYYQPVSELAAARVYPRGTEEKAAFYLESQLLVRYLIERYGAPQFFEFLRNTVQSKSPSYSLRQVYELDLDDLEADFRTYAAEGPPAD